MYQVSEAANVQAQCTGFMQNSCIKVRKRTKIRNRYNQAPHLAQNTNGKVTASQLAITNESQEVSPFQAGDHKASTNRREPKHNKQDRNNMHDPQKKHFLLNGQ